MMVLFAPRAGVRKLCASIWNARTDGSNGAFWRTAVDEIHHAHVDEHGGNEDEPKALNVLEPAVVHPNEPAVGPGFRRNGLVTLGGYMLMALGSAFTVLGIDLLPGHRGECDWLSARSSVGRVTRAVSPTCSCSAPPTLSRPTISDYFVDEDAAAMLEYVERQKRSD
jgi:hypothetical protein